MTIALFCRFMYIHACIPVYMYIFVSDAGDDLLRRLEPGTWRSGFELPPAWKKDFMRIAFSATSVSTTSDNPFEGPVEKGLDYG